MIDTLAPFNLINPVDTDISRLWAHLELSDVGESICSRAFAHFVLHLVMDPFCGPLQSLTLLKSQHHVEPRRKEEDHEDVPVHQGRGHLPRGTHVALHQAGAAEIPHRRGGACLPGCCP